MAQSNQTLNYSGSVFSQGEISPVILTPDYSPTGQSDTGPAAEDDSSWRQFLKLHNFGDHPADQDDVGTADAVPAIPTVTVVDVDKKVLSDTIGLAGPIQGNPTREPLIFAPWMDKVRPALQFSVEQLDRMVPPVTCENIDQTIGFPESSDEPRMNIREGQPFYKAEIWLILRLIDDNKTPLLRMCQIAWWLGRKPASCWKLIKNAGSYGVVLASFPRTLPNGQQTQIYRASYPETFDIRYLNNPLIGLRTLILNYLHYYIEDGGTVTVPDKQMYPGAGQFYYANACDELLRQQPSLPPATI